MIKKLRTAALSVLVCSAAAAAVGFSGLGKQVSYAEVWEASAIEKTYEMGSVFRIPERTVSVGGNTATASALLVCPDQTATAAASVVLDQAGTYCVKYAAEIGGIPYAAEERFNVYGNLMSYGEDTTISYGLPDTAKSKEGMLVSLAKDDTLAFTQYLDVSTLTKDEEFCEFYIFPNNRGVADFDIIVFTLTDIENPDIYVKIRAHRYIDRDGIAYFSAGGNGQPMVGYEADKNIIHTDNNFGMATTLAFEAREYNWSTGTYSDRASDAYPVKLYFDAETLGVWATCNHSMYGGEIVDLDSPNYFETLWSGFPSGRAFLSVSGEDFNSSNANICFISVMGMDVAKYSEKHVDDVGPEITIDGADEALPEGRTGGFYPIPSASAKDVYSGVCEVRTSVWYNYADEEKRVMTELRDGKALTPYAGYYAIVYEASDAFANTTREILWFHTGSPIDELEVIVPEDKKTSAELGEWVEVPAPASVGGGSGRLTVSAAVSFGGESYEITDGFRPEKEGVWTVMYTVTDATGETKTASYTVNVVRGTRPMLVEEPVMPKYFISGSSYDIPVLYADDYTSGSLERKLFDVVVTDRNGEKTYKAGEAFVPEADVTGEIATLSYRIGSVELAKLEIPVILAWDSASKLQVQNYFFGEGFETEKTSDGIIIKALSGASKAEWTFANSLAAEDFELILNTLSGSGKYEKLTVTLTDSESSGISVSAKFTKSGTRTYFNVTGNTPLELSYTFDSAQEITLGYKRSAFSFGKTLYPIAAADSGEAFEGFPSGKVYLTVTAEGISGAAAYGVKSLNGHPFTTSSRDRVAPRVVVMGDYGGTLAKGDSYTIGSAIASDVLSPSVVFGLTVRDPENNVISDVNGIRLENVDPSREYTILLELYGQYKVVYTAQEAESFVAVPNSMSFTYVVNVEDDEPPVITFEKGFKLTAAVGDTIVIPNFTVSDNVTPAEEIAVAKCIVNPNGKVIVLQGSENAIVCAYAGIYEIRIMAWDTDGNMKMIRVYVTVEEAAEKTDGAQD